MDTTVFVLRREEIQERMNSRRLRAISAYKADPPHILPWVLNTGIGLVSGLRSSSGSLGWLASLAGAFILPNVMKFVAPKNGRSETVWHRLARAVLPSLRI